MHHKAKHIRESTQLARAETLISCECVRKNTGCAGSSEEKLKLWQLRFVLECELYKRIVTMKAELLTDICPMILDRPIIDKQVRGNFLAGVSVRDQTQDS